MLFQCLIVVAAFASVLAGHDATSYASVNSYAEPSNGGGYGHDEKHYADHYPTYDYKYGVEDHHTGDKKSQHEDRDGDVVKGHYSVHQPDGRIRTVHYTSDKHTGFNAQVEYSGHAIHPSYSKHY